MVDLLRLSTMGQSAPEGQNAVAADSKVTLDAGMQEEEIEPTSPSGTEAATASGQAQEQEESSDIASASSNSGSSDENDAQPTCWNPGFSMAHHSKSCGSLLPFLKQQTLCGRLIDDEHF